MDRRLLALVVLLPGVALAAPHWVPQAKLLASDGVPWNRLGFSAALTGDTLVVGAPCNADPPYNVPGVGPGTVYVFARSSGTWVQQARLAPSDATMDMQFGYSVSIDGDTIAASAYRHNPGSGAVYVFMRDGSNWTEKAKLTGGYINEFAYAVSISGDTVLVGAQGEDAHGADSGAAYAFRRDNGGTWFREALIVPADGQAWDGFGHAVTLRGDTALVGAPGNDENGAWTGAAYVYERAGTVWAQQAKLMTADAAENFFGGAVAVFGDTALVGAPDDGDVATQAGAAYVFTRTAGVWVEQAKLLPGDATMRWFGTRVALDEDRALIAGMRDQVPVTWPGWAYVFSRNLGTWSEQASLVASQAAYDATALAVALDGDTAVVGAGYDDDRGENAGAAQVFVQVGGPCTDDGECGSGHCADSVCCDTACAAVCRSCGLAGYEGTCQPVVNAQDPGTCDGTAYCGPTGVCLRAAGEPCAPDAQDCQTTFCVDGVCCESACDGLCERCAASGLCRPVTAGTDPDGACPGVGACRGACDGARACRYPAGASCGLCAACDGAGGCTSQPADDPACGVLACSALSTACRDYADLTTARCAALGSCRHVDLATCTEFADAPPGTPCACPLGSPGICQTGECECLPADAGTDATGAPDARPDRSTDGTPPALDGSVTAELEPRGCSCRAAGVAGRSPALVLAAVLLVRRLRRRS
jgi:hypothetical protein